MASLILTTDDSGAGCLKVSQIADHVVAVPYRLVSGPVPPVSEPIAFFAERAKLGGPDVARWDEDRLGRTPARCWSEFTNKCQEFEHVEIWPDPDPNGQLQLVQILDWVHSKSDIVQKVALVNVDFRIGSRRPEDIALLRSQGEKLSEAQFEVAKVALRAFQQPTPEAWFGLLHRRDLDALPHLRPTVTRLLEELPAGDTALTSSATKLLDIISRSHIGPMRVLGEYIADNPLSVFDYWELGEALHRLARCEMPAIVGLNEDRFTLELHDDSERFSRYKASKLSLSEFGRALLQGRADFSRYNRIDLWWGGTRLTNDRLWRWHASNNALVAPA